MFYVKFLDRLKEHRRQFRIVYRQEPVSTHRDEFRIDLLDFLGNHTDLTIRRLVRVIPGVIDAAKSLEVFQGAIQRDNVLLETLIRRTGERVRHDRCIHVQKHLQRCRLTGQHRMIDTKIIHATAKGVRRGHIIGSHTE